MITADVYPLIKNGRITYDDIMKFGSITVSDLKLSIITELKDLVVNNLNKETENHDIPFHKKRNNHHATKSVSNNCQRQKNLIAFLTLVKLGEKIADKKSKIGKREAKTLVKVENQFEDNSLNLNATADLKAWCVHPDQKEFFQNTKDIQSNYALNGTGIDEGLDTKPKLKDSSKSLELCDYNSINNLPKIDFHSFNRFSWNEDSLIDYQGDEDEFGGESVNGDEFEGLFTMNKRPSINPIFGESNRTWQVSEVNHQPKLSLKKSEPTPVNKQDFINSNKQRVGQESTFSACSKLLDGQSSVFSNINLTLKLISEDYESVHNLKQQKFLYNVAELTQPISIEVTQNSNIKFNMLNKEKIQITVDHSLSQNNRN